jgi:iron complex outermembrane receptor protein
LLHGSDPPTGQANIEARSTFGSYGLARQAFDAAARPSELSTLQATYSHLASDGYRGHSTASTIRGDVVADVTLSDNDNVRIDGRYTEFHALSPGALTQSELDTNPRMAAASSIKANASKDGHQNQLSAVWAHAFESTLLRATGYLIGRTLTNPIVGKITDLGRTAGGAEVTLTPAAMSDDAGKPVAFLWNGGASFELQNDGRTSYANVSGAKGAINLDQQENVTAIAAFGSATWTPLDDLSAMISARYDRTRFAVTDHYITDKDPDDSGDRWMDALSPSFGVIWRATDHLNVFSNVSTSFETPTTTELSNQPTGAGGFNPDLNPQRAIGYEVGLRSFISPLLQFTLTGYLTDIRDELIPFEVPGAPGRSYYRNAGSARHQGLEASLHATLLDSLSLTSAFSVIDARYRSYAIEGIDYSGMKVPGIAQTLLDVTAEYRAPLGFDVSATFSAVGRSFANDANTVTSPAHNILDLSLSNNALRIGSVWGASLKLAAGVQNVLDVKYVSSVVVNAAANRYFEPGAGRSYWLTASLALDRTYTTE